MPDRSSPAFPAAIAIVTASILLSACASTVMKSYIGAPISSVMLDYGPPDNIYSLGAGQQAYQWRKTRRRRSRDRRVVRYGQHGVASVTKCPRRRVMWSA